MAYPIDKKLVIAVASSALFDLTESDSIFREQGIDSYRQYQRDNKTKLLDKGVAFSFIKRFLHINQAFSEEEPVEVVLLSKNDPDTGARVTHSISEYGLNITRAAFLSGKSPFPYIPSFNVSLFLSANDEDVNKAIEAGFAAGTVISSVVIDDEDDHELRIAFDFDGVIADDEAEKVFHHSEDVATFNQHEVSKASIPHRPGPLSDLFKKLSYFQKIERQRVLQDKTYQRILRIAIVTARAAPAHERVVTTLTEWGVEPDETFFLGGIDKNRILRELKPHMFFDDQMRHVESTAGSIPSVHIPFGIKNKHKT